MIEKSMKSFKVPYSCIWGRVDNTIKSYYRAELETQPDREHMKKILQYSPGIFCVFKSKTRKLDVQYKPHFSNFHYAIPIKSKVEPMVMGLDSSGIWRLLNYIHVFDTKVEGKIKSDQDLKFSVEVDFDCQMFQVCFPTASTMLNISISSDDDIEFVKPPKCKFVFIGSSVSQDNYSSNHMNICPYMFRKFGVNVGTLAVSGYHTFQYKELMEYLAKCNVKCVLMDVLHIVDDEYVKGKKMLGKNMEQFIVCDRRTKPLTLTEKYVPKEDVFVSSGDCMWDSVHLNDFGTVEFAKALVNRKHFLIK